MFVYWTYMSFLLTSYNLLILSPTVLNPLLIKLLIFIILLCLKFLCNYCFRISDAPSEETLHLSLCVLEHMIILWSPIRFYCLLFLTLVIWLSSWLSMIIFTECWTSCLTVGNSQGFGRCYLSTERMSVFSGMSMSTDRSHGCSWGWFQALEGTEVSIFSLPLLQGTAFMPRHMLQVSYLKTWDANWGFSTFVSPSSNLFVSNQSLQSSSSASQKLLFI